MRAQGGQRHQIHQGWSRRIVGCLLQVLGTELGSRGRVTATLIAAQPPLQAPREAMITRQIYTTMLHGHYCQRLLIGE